jgi:DNA-directed RNA polymerase specialized sigma24 family protein
MPSTTAPENREDFLRELQAIREDPRVCHFALGRAGDRDLAEDALESAYCAVARVRDPEAINDLRKYFCRTVTNEIYRLRGQLGASLVEDFEDVADTRQDRSGCGPVSPRPVEETVCTSVQGQIWRDRFAARRDQLRADVAGRSDDPERYRTVIVNAAGRVLAAILNVDVCDADSNDALRAAYPEWFGAGAPAANNAHQRFSRARADVRKLLMAVVNRGELLA